MTGMTTLAEIPTLYQKYGVFKKVLDRISLWKGDITELEIDAIVNAANSGLRGGGGVDGAIHRAAGYGALQNECRKIGHCDVGDAVITSGCGISHVKNIIHTVGPRVSGDEPSDEDKSQLKSCYRKSLKLAVKHNLKSIAFCCISTGIYGYPNDDAAWAAGNTILAFLKNNEEIERIVLCTFLPVDEENYTEYFNAVAEKYKDDKE